MADIETFRSETRSWLEANCPPTMRTPGETIWGGRRETFDEPESKIWLERMAERGWTAPRWPTEYGGGGLSVEEDMVLQQEMARIKARSPLASFGLWMLGPALLEFASEEQKLEHLPKIVRGEIRWCQGYSEPGSGSDLASLQTKAEDKGDYFLVNGSKVWTSYADEADWIFCLVRTDPSAAKHDGISFLLFDMESEGVSTQPIKLISGSSPFCQTFFDNVSVPKGNLVGEANRGWSIAKRLLQHERQMISGIGGASAAGGRTRGLADLAAEYDALGDPGLRDAIAVHQMNDRSFALTLRRSAEAAKAGKADGNLTSMFKLYGSEQNKLKSELHARIMGNSFLGWEGPGYDDRELGATRAWLRTKANSIEGGTSEVQLNVIAKRVLGLPD